MSSLFRVPFRAGVRFFVIGLGGARDRPDEANHLACDGDDGDLRRFAARRETEVAPMQTFLRLEGVVHNGVRLSVPARLHRGASRGGMPVVPRSLNEDAPRVA